MRNVVINFVFCSEMTPNAKCAECDPPFGGLWHYETIWLAFEYENLEPAKNHSQLKIRTVSARSGSGFGALVLR